MSTELTILAWTLVLAFVYVMAATMFRNGETGLAYNAGNRDAEAPPMRPVTARLKRAQKNLYESLPMFIGAVLIAQAANVHSPATIWGCWMFFIARFLYLPVYGIGIPYIRTLIWGVGTVGIAMILWAVLKTA
jgi:uncharacterized MAPEG superfamily protein